MGHIFDFNFRLSTNQYWRFNLNHLFLFMFLIISLLALFLNLRAKGQRGIKWTKISLVFIIVSLEIARMIYMVVKHLGTQGYVNWWIVWNFELCAIFVWLTVVALIISCFKDKDNKFLVILKNTLYGGAAIGGVAVFINPSFITTYLPIYHFGNSQSIIQHVLIAFVPIYFIKIGELRIEFRNIWMPLVGFLGVFTLTITASHISRHSFFLVLYDHAVFIDILRIDLPHPSQIFFTFISIIIINLILFSVFDIYRHFKSKEKIQKEKIIIDSFMVITILTSLIVIMSNLFLPVLLGADFQAPIDNYERRAVGSWSALLILVPYMLFISLMVYLAKQKGKSSKELRAS